MIVGDGEGAALRFLVEGDESIFMTAAQIKVVEERGERVGDKRNGVVRLGGTQQTRDAGAKGGVVVRRRGAARKGEVGSRAGTIRDRST